VIECDNLASDFNIANDQIVVVESEPSRSISINREENCNLRLQRANRLCCCDVRRCRNQINPVESGQVAKRSVRKLRRHAMEMHCLNTISPATMNDLFYMSFMEQSIEHRLLRIMPFLFQTNSIFSTVVQFLFRFYVKHETSELSLKSDKRTIHGDSIPRLITVERKIRRRKAQNCEATTSHRQKIANNAMTPV